ncbi:MAG TPA: hypothetical protein VFQ53_02940 [Kofleriaceae bacterium]|nr:hypothetical protein [Kofleriaceae bacterium]
MRSGKWLAIAAAALLVALVILWRSMSSSSATPAVAATPVESARSGTIQLDKPAAAAAVAEPAAAEEPAAPSPTGKLDKMSDEFFFRFTEQVPYKLSRNAATCYDKPGLLHRNQKLVLKFNVKVKDGNVTVEDVKVDTSTLNNPALESCFIREVARTSWRDDALPDYTWPDELVIRPERGLKKHWKSNLEYVGAEAPKRAE